MIVLSKLPEASTLEEICQIMDLSMSNAKTKLCRARQRLKIVLETNFQAEYGSRSREPLNPQPSNL